MTTLAKQFGLIIFAGFIAFGLAFGYGSMVGDLLADQPGLAALRLFGCGLIASGLTLWVALRRAEAGKAGLNPLFGLLIGAGSLLLFINLLFPGSTLSAIISWGGIGLVGAALVIGLLVTILSPAFPRPVTKRWPEGGEGEAGTTSGHTAH